MTVTSITSAIMAEVKEKAASMIEGVTKEADRLVRDEQERLAKILEDQKANIDKEAERVYGTEMVKVNLTLRNEALKAQRSFVDKAFDNALERLHSQKKDERKKTLGNLLKQATGQMDVATVFVNAHDKGLVKGRFKVQTADIQGGLIAESKTGDIRIDLSYEAILADIEEMKVETITSVVQP